MTTTGGAAVGERVPKLRSSRRRDVILMQQAAELVSSAHTSGSLAAKVPSCSRNRRLKRKTAVKRARSGSTAQLQNFSDDQIFCARSSRRGHQESGEWRPNEGLSPSVGRARFQRSR
jgi:hypothetical protein